MHITRQEAEAIRAEALRTGDEALIRQWNAWCIEEGKRMDARAKARKQGISGAEFFYGMWGR